MITAIIKLKDKELVRYFDKYQEEHALLWCEMTIKRNPKSYCEVLRNGKKIWWDGEKI